MPVGDQSTGTCYGMQHKKVTVGGLVGCNTVTMEGNEHFLGRRNMQPHQQVSPHLLLSYSSV